MSYWAPVAVGVATTLAQAVPWWKKYGFRGQRYDRETGYYRVKKARRTLPPFDHKQSDMLLPARVAKRRKFGPPEIDEDIGDEGGYIQETRAKLRSGRRPKKAQIMRVMGKADLLSRTLFFKRLPTSFKGDFGQYPLSYFNDAAGTQSKYPIYVCNLMQLPGSALSPLNRLTVSEATGLLSWEGQVGQSLSGADNAQMQVLRVSPGFPNIDPPYPPGIPYKEFYWGNVNIKLCLYGCTTRNTQFEVMLVQFENDLVSPTQDDNNLNTGGLTGDALEHQSFWQEQVKALVAHPCAIGTYYGQQSKMKILKYEKIHIGPTTNIQNDSNPHHYILNWTHGISKKTNMRLSGTNAMSFNAQTNAKTTIVDTTGGQGVLTQTCKAPDRVYLILRANDYDVTTAAETAATSASFDIGFTTTHYVNI